MVALVLARFFVEDGVITRTDPMIDEFYDTLAASRRCFKYLPNHQLHTVAAECGYQLENHHHALADAEACAWIAREIL